MIGEVLIFKLNMANFKIGPNRLDKGELTFELVKRTVDTMRTRLTMARRMEKLRESFSYSTYSFTLEDDIAVATVKIGEFSKLKKSFTDTLSSELFTKYLSKCNHLMQLIDHIPKDIHDRPELLTRVDTALLCPVNVM